VTTIVVPYHLDEYLPGLDVEGSVSSGPLPGSDLWARLGGLYGIVASRVAASLPAVVVSGDCTVSLGTVAGVQAAGISPAVVWFDAHGDVQTIETSHSGYVGGMPVRFLCGYRPSLISTALGLTPLPEASVLLVDARDLDPPEVEYLSSAEVRVCAVAEVAEAVLPPGPIVLHLDLDVIDGERLPGLRFAVPGGASVEDVVAAARRVVATGRVVAMDIACTWDPAVPDASGVRERVVAELVGLMG
jgi:arginase